MVSSVNNPLKHDAELKVMLEKVEYIKTARTFKRWKTSFLIKFEAYLEEAGVVAAKNAERSFANYLTKLLVLVEKLEKYVEKGDLSVEKYFTSVKARNCLNEWYKMLTKVILELDSLIPSTGREEKQKCYNKFHMGAVLVRDDFGDFGRLTKCRETIGHMREESLNQVAGELNETTTSQEIFELIQVLNVDAYKDKQILEEMDNYARRLSKFCDVMADLGLYDVMLKCREFANTDMSDDLIFLDLKTSGIGEMSRSDCIQNKLLTLIRRDEQSNDVFQETASDDENKEKLMTIMRQSPKLGLGFGNANNTFDEEDIVSSEAEKIKNIWGVQLRKTPKNLKGQEFIFIDPLNGTYGEISRQLAIEKEIITEIQDEGGTLILGEAETDFQERAALVEQIRGLLDFGVKHKSADNIPGSSEPTICLERPVSVDDL